jgi:hypothetical protein
MAVEVIWLVFRSHFYYQERKTVPIYIMAFVSTGHYSLLVTNLRQASGQRLPSGPQNNSCYGQVVVTQRWTLAQA